MVESRCEENQKNQKNKTKKTVTKWGERDKDLVEKKYSKSSK